MALYTGTQLKRMSDAEILGILRRHGHRGWEVDGETLDTPGGAARIHAYTHSWAKNYPQVRWAPEDIQLLHELAVRQMQRAGFRHVSPIESELEAGIQRYGPEAWKGLRKGVRGYVARAAPREELLAEIRKLIQEMGGLKAGKRAIIHVDYPGNPVRIACHSYGWAVDLATAIENRTGYSTKITTFAGRPLWPAGKYRTMAHEYNPAVGDRMEVYYDRRYGTIGVLSRPGFQVAFVMTPKQWARFKQYRGTKPMRIFKDQVLPGWTPKEAEKISTRR